MPATRIVIYGFLCTCLIPEMVMSQLTKKSIQFIKGNCRQSTHNIWKVGPLLEFTKQTRINHLGIWYIKEDVDSDFYQAMEQLHASSLALGIIEQRGNATFDEERFDVLLQRNVRHFAVLHSMDERTYRIWYEIFRQTCNRIYWVLFQEEMDLFLFLKNMASEDCRSSYWALVVRKHGKSKHHRGYIIYNPRYTARNSQRMKFAKQRNFQSRNAKEYFPSLSGITIRVAFNEYIPYIFHGKTNPLGMEAELIYSLQEKFGFQIKFSSPDDRQWGRLSENGTWNGMVAMLQKKEADLAVSCCAQSISRSTVVDSSSTYGSEPLVFTSRAPGYESKVYVLTKPFSHEVWILLVLTSLIGFFLLYLLSGFRSYLVQSKKIAVTRIAWDIYCTLVDQGFRIAHFKGLAFSAFLLPWLLYSLIVTRSYSGNLVSYMALMKREKPIDTLEDMADAIRTRDFRIGARRGTRQVNDLLALDTENLKIISNSARDETSHFVSLEKALERVLLENYVVYDPKSGAVFMAKKLGVGQLLHYGPPVNTADVSILIRKKFPYLRDFNIIIRRLSEMGFIERWMEVASDQAIKVAASSRRNGTDQEMSFPPEDDHPEIALSVRELKGPFLFLLYGYGLSAFVLVIECIYFKASAISNSKK